MTNERNHEQAREVIEGCPQLYDQPCLLTEKTFNALVQRIEEYGRQARRGALEEAASLCRQAMLFGMAQTISEKAKG